MFLFHENIKNHFLFLIKYSAPDYPVLKEYMDSMLDLIKDLEIDHVFVHADEAVYANLCHILLWKHKELYNNILLLMGGFHQLQVCNSGVLLQK